MSYGNNPYAALSQRQEPAPRKNLAKAKQASKVHKPKQQDKKKPQANEKERGRGNNSAKPGRPEKSQNRKGRTMDRKPGNGRAINESKRGGKDWGVDQKQLVAEGEAAARNGKKNGRERRNKKRDDDEELTEEQLAALQAEREKEARQMTLAEWEKKKSSEGGVKGVDFKEARKVQMDDDLQKLSAIRGKKEMQTDEWSTADQAKKKKGKKKKNNKKETLQLGSAPPRRRNNNRDNNKRGGRNGNNRGGNGRRNNQPSLKLDDDRAFPSLGGN